MATAELPPAVADLIRQGEATRAAQRAEADRRRREAEERDARRLEELRVAVAVAVPGLEARGLTGFLRLYCETPQPIDLTGEASAVITFPGCAPITLIAERHPTDGWRAGRAGDRDPYRTNVASGTYGFPTLAEAAVAARSWWLENQPVPAGLS